MGRAEFQEGENRYTQEQREMLLRQLVEFRLLLGDALAAIDAYVLTPLCEECAYHIYGEMPESYGGQLTYTHDAIAMYPNDRTAGMVRFFSQVRHQLFRWPKRRRGRHRHIVDCCQCGIPVNDDDDTIMSILTIPYSEYFGLWEKETKVAPEWVRNKLLEWYGSKCFMCGSSISRADLSCDHIIPKSKGGKGKPSNFQPLCKPCDNQRKKDQQPQRVYIALDFLTRPVPSDAYSELIW